MDQLICASLSHSYYWYEGGMLTVPASVRRAMYVRKFEYLDMDVWSSLWADRAQPVYVFANPASNMNIKVLY